MIKAIFIFILITTTSMANLPKERRLKKLSMHIRGITPTAQEYKELANAENVTEYFLDKTKSYLKSSEHSDKMNIRLGQLFRLGLPQYVSESFNKSERNSLNMLFRDISEKNLSWDTLLVGKKYWLTMSSEPFSQSDFGFLGAVLPANNNTPRVDNGIISISDRILKTATIENESEEIEVFTAEHEFNVSDSRIAGALTTERFFNRNVNTAVNKNRKRAASVFRIFLCDDMEAAITDASDRGEYILDFVFPNTTGMSGADIMSTSITESAHGNSPDCMACHYKLDPLGKNFGGSGNSLSPVPFKGALTYKSSEGNNISIETNGLGDLARKIIEQKDYKLCQTKQFWKWFIGEDKHLDKETHHDLVEEFERVDGRVNDFISYMVNRKEFYNITSLSSEAKLAFTVKGTLKNCNQCHDKKGLPSFTEWPIQNENGDMNYWVGEIGKSLGLKSTERNMPPSDHIWQPTQQDIDDINEWIRIGAPNEQGNRQVP